MALFRCSSGGGGGAPTLSQLLYNSGKTLLGQITTVGGSYTTTQDCVMYVKSIGTGSYSPFIFFDGVRALSSSGTNGSKYSLYVGYSDTGATTPDSYGMFVPQGTAVSTRNQSGQTYDVKFYTLD